MSVFAPGNQQGRFKVPVGVRPNGLSFDRGAACFLLPTWGALKTGRLFALRGGHHAPEDDSLNPRPGTDALDSIRSSRGPLHVNIADPPRILVVEAAHPDKATRELTVPAAGPHGLDLDADGQILYCACDAEDSSLLRPRTVPSCRQHP